MLGLVYNFLLIDYCVIKRLKKIITIDFRMDYALLFKLPIGLHPFINLFRNQLLRNKQAKNKK